MKAAKLLRRHAKWTLGLVAVGVIFSTMTASAGPVLMPVEICKTDVATMPTVCSEPDAKCIPAVIQRHCIVVELWVGCRQPGACAELNRQWACWNSWHRQTCLDWLGLESSNRSSLIDQSIQW